MEDTLVMDFIKSLNEAKLHRHMNFEGLDISIEVPADGFRRGKNKKTGEEWAVKIPAHYGYIKGTHSPDGEHLDCYVRKNPKKDAKVYVMHQMTVDGSKFDEDKVMLGYSNKNEAIKAFKSMTFKPTTMYGGCTEFDMEHFQVIAFSASKSHAMLARQETYADFKKRGLLGKNIKSPIMVARKVSESLAEGLSEIAECLNRGDVQECLEWGGLDENADVETVLDLGYQHYKETPHMRDSGTLSEDEFRDRALKYIMETDALLTDVEDQFYEDTIQEDNRLDVDLFDDNLDLPVCEASVEEKLSEEEAVMESNNFVVVVHTQIMENIGSAVNPSWATAGTKTILVQEGFADYGSARAVAAQVSAGTVPVTLSEGAYVLGIDVLPIGEYRQFYEDANSEPAEEIVDETTEEVFFQQQIMEAQRLAGVRHGASPVSSTPTVHETRARLEELSKGFFEAIHAETHEEEVNERMMKGYKLTVGQIAHALRVVRATIKKNPQSHINQVIKAVCAKLFGDPKLDGEIIKQAEFEYGSLEEFDNDARSKKQASPKVITKKISER
jgi:hypothetical protein